MMIECHHTLNIALNRKHFARVELPASLTQTEAIKRSRLIADAIALANPMEGGSWSFDLSYVSCSGRSVWGTSQ